MTKRQRKRNRMKLVEALRSGIYIQGTGRLCNNDKYCCLGVLSDIAGCEKTRHGKVILFDREEAVAPKRAMDFVGLRTNFGDIGGGISLTRLNDYKIKNENGSVLPRFTFDEIADIIQMEPEGLFVD